MKTLKLSLISCSLLFIIACSTETKTSEEESSSVSNETEEMNDLAGFTFSYTIDNLPPPMEVLQEIVSAGLDVNTSLLCPVVNASKSNTSFQQAINYGIYGVDLAYAGFYEQTGSMVKYYPVVKGLANRLDLSTSFNVITDRYENFSKSPDSMKRIVDELYVKTDKYLRNNDRLETASQILAGSWLEAQHITVGSLLGVTRTKRNETIFNRVWEQRLHLKNISELLDQIEETGDIKNVKDNFNSLLEIYKEPAQSSDINQDYLKKLAGAIAKVRSSING